MRGSALWKFRGVGAAIAAVTAALAGCTTTGTGTGEASSGNLGATFAWTSGDGVRGAMTANLSNGAVYQGPFFQVTQETNYDSMGPLWIGWEGRGRWRGWDDWGPDMGTATKYTGKVLANLQGPKGYMRCRFTLATPSSGMAAGGVGQCQLPKGTIIQAQFPSH